MLLIAVSVGLLVVLRFAVRAYRLQAQAEAGGSGGKSGPELNAKIPTLEVHGLAGDVITLGRPRRAAQLVLFAKSTCSRCRIAIEVLRPFISERPGVEAIVVCGDSRDSMPDCAALVGSPLKAVGDADGTGAAAWGVPRMPFGVVVDATGYVRSRGDPTETALLSILNQLLQNGNTSPKQRPNEKEGSSTAPLRGSHDSG